MLKFGECLGKTVLIGKTELLRNLLDGKIAEVQKIAGPFNFPATNECLRALFHRRGKEPDKRIARQAAMIRQHIVVQLFIQML